MKVWSSLMTIVLVRHHFIFLNNSRQSVEVLSPLHTAQIHVSVKCCQSNSKLILNIWYSRLSIWSALAFLRCHMYIEIALSHLPHLEHIMHVILVCSDTYVIWVIWHYGVTNHWYDTVCDTITDHWAVNTQIVPWVLLCAPESTCMSNYVLSWVLIYNI